MHRKVRQPDGIKINRSIPLFGINDTTMEHERESEQKWNVKFVKDVEKAEKVLRMHR